MLSANSLILPCPLALPSCTAFIHLKKSCCFCSQVVYSIREYLNVDGFEKYTFNLILTSFANGEKNKVVSTSETVTGRSQADALLKVKNYFTDYIEQHLSDLELD